MPSRRRALEQRLARVTALQQGENIDQQARAALEQQWSEGAAPAVIRVRETFISLSRPLPGQHSDKHPPTPDKGPPLAKLISPRGASLRTALIALFVAQTTRGTPARLQDLRVDPSDERLGWRHLVLAPADHDPAAVRAVTPRDNKIRQIKNALDDLSSLPVGVLALPRAGTARARYDDIRLLHEGGTRPTGPAPEYTVPRSNERTVAIPAEFFVNGWVHALDDSELAAWLMFRHRYLFQLPAAAAAGVELNGQDRLANYVLKRSTWDQHRNLGLYGLLRHEADDRRRTDGTVDDFAEKGRGRRHRFWMIDEPLSSPAVHTIAAALAAAADDGSPT